MIKKIGMGYLTSKNYAGSMILESKVTKIGGTNV